MALEMYGTRLSVFYCLNKSPKYVYFLSYMEIMECTFFIKFLFPRKKNEWLKRSRCMWYKNVPFSLLHFYFCDTRKSNTKFDKWLSCEQNKLENMKKEKKWKINGHRQI